MLRGQRDGSAGPRGRSGTLSSRTSTYSGSPCGPATPAQRRRRGWPRVPAVTASRLPPVSPPGGRARLDAGVRAGAAGFLWSPCRLVSYWWAAGGAVQNLSDWDRSRPAPQGRRLHHFHRHARPHRAHHLGLHRRRAEPDTGELTVDHRRMLLAVAGAARLYAYLGMGLALPSQLCTGQECLTSPAATVFWRGCGLRWREASSSGGGPCLCRATPGTGAGSPRSSPRARGRLGVRVRSAAGYAAAMSSASPRPAR